MTTFESRYSRLAGRISSSDSDGWEVSDRAKRLQREGEDIILLCVGDPDFRTPEPIIDNAVSYLRVDRTHYSPALGELKLRRAVADLESRTSPHPCSVEEVAIFPGATASLHAVMTCLLDAGDEVIIPEPMYVGYQPIMSAIDAKVVSVPLDVKSGFALDMEAIKSALEFAVFQAFEPGFQLIDLVNQRTQTFDFTIVSAAKDFSSESLNHRTCF